MLHRLSSLIIALIVGLAGATAAEPLPLRKPMLDDNGRTFFPTIGSNFRGLVIPIEFTEKSFAKPDIADRVSELLNTRGYTKGHALGSVADYFEECSLGLFKPQFDVVQPVTLSHTASYYAGDTGTDRFFEAAAEAINTLIERKEDFAKYDCNNDGFIDSIIFLFAGKENAGGQSPPTLSTHFGSLILSELSVDGKIFGDYAAISELRGDGSLQGIGPFCREFAHSLGLPFLSPPSGSAVTANPERWSLMADGYLNGNGDCPPALSAFELYTLRWLDFTEAEELPESTPSMPLFLPDMAVQLPHLLSPERKALRLFARVRTGGERDASEYFILETRGESRWDEALPDCGGMLIWRIDYEPYYWINEQVNAYTVARATTMPKGKFVGQYLFGERTDWYNPTSDSYLPTLTQGYSFPVELGNILYSSESQTTSLVIAPSERPFCNRTTTFLPAERTEWNKPTIRVRWVDAGDDCSYRVSIYRGDTPSRRIYLNDCNSVNTNDNYLDITDISPSDWDLSWTVELRVVNPTLSSYFSSYTFTPNLCDYSASLNLLQADDRSGFRPYSEGTSIVAPPGSEIYSLAGARVQTIDESQHSYPLSAGIYIVRRGNRAAKLLISN